MLYVYIMLVTYKKIEKRKGERSSEKEFVNQQLFVKNFISKL